MITSWVMAEEMQFFFSRVPFFVLSRRLNTDALIVIDLSIPLIIYIYM